MTSKIKYSPLEDDAKKIWRLVENQRFRNPEAFIDRAVQVLLAWELDPRTSMDIMKGYPQTDEQKSILKEFLDPGIYQKNFEMDNSEKITEDGRYKQQKESKDDHLKLLENLEDTRKHIKSLTILPPKNLDVGYDGYPILSRFYSRFAPAKIVLSVLADLLRQNPTSSKINLKLLRADALDIAIEFAERIIEFEEKNNIKRTKKVSTGFPKPNALNVERIPSIHKRFKDHYVGIVRKNRSDERLYFAGILAALDLAYIIKEGKEYFITLTENGREFYLLDNPILNKDYSRGLSDEESAFIFRKLIPRLRLEKLFYDAALDVIKKYEYDEVLQRQSISEALDQEIINVINIFTANNSDEKWQNDIALKYVIDKRTHEQKLDKKSEKYVEGWRIATMGRLTELKKVVWNIGSDGKSQFILNPKTKITN